MPGRNSNCGSSSLLFFRSLVNDYKYRRELLMRFDPQGQMAFALCRRIARAIAPF